MAFLLAFLGFGKTLFSGVVAWLSRRSLSEIVCIILVCALVMVFLDARHWKAVASQRQAQLVTCNATQVSLRAQLNAISTRKNTQQVITKTNLVTVTKVIHNADNVAKKVETAPLPGKCKSPKEVLNADL